MYLTHRRRSMPLAAFLTALAIGTTGCAAGPPKTECPDGTVVTGTECQLTADGVYVGNEATVPEDVADDTADVSDEEADEESGLVPVEVEVIEVEKK
jgi:hypothetical protein